MQGEIKITTALFALKAIDTATASTEESQQIKKNEREKGFACGLHMFMLMSVCA